MSGVADKLKFPQKIDQFLGSRRDAWCEFHRAFGHSVEQCITLSNQLAYLVKEGFLKEYLEANQEKLRGKVAIGYQTHENPIHGELNSIVGGSSKGGSSTSKRKRYARAVMSLDTRRYDRPAEPSLCVTGSNLEDVFPHEDDPMVISVVMVGRKMHRVLIDQASSADVMFWGMFTSLQISPD